MIKYKINNNETNAQIVKTLSNQQNQQNLGKHNIIIIYNITYLLNTKIT